MRTSVLTAVAAVVSVAAATPLDLAKRASYANGQISYFTYQGKYGSCGEIHKDDENVVAISYKLQGSSYPPPYCGRRVMITHQGADVAPDGSATDRTVEATVVDTCTTCDDSHLELSVNAYETLTGKKFHEPAEINRIQWNFV